MAARFDMEKVALVVVVIGISVVVMVGLVVIGIVVVVMIGLVVVIEIVVVGLVVIGIVTVVLRVPVLTFVNELVSLGKSSTDYQLQQIVDCCNQIYNSIVVV
jgi:hypothetical protein